MPRGDNVLEDLLNFTFNRWTTTREVVGENEIVTFTAPVDPDADQYTVTFLGETPDTIA